MSGINVLLNMNNIIRILQGMWEALTIAGISLVIGSLLGVVFGILRLSESKVIRWIFKLYLELVRILPILVLLYLLYYLMPQLIEQTWSHKQVSVVVFVIWISAETSDLVRASLLSVPKAQIESGRALGFTPYQIFKEIRLPQAVPTLIAPMVNLATRVIKTTSLLMMIGVDEMIRVGQQIVERYTYTIPTASLWVYGFIMVLYFILCYPLSKFAKHIEVKMSQNRRQ